MEKEVHKPLTFPTDREWLIKRAIEEEESGGCISVGGLYCRVIEANRRHVVTTPLGEPYLIELTNAQINAMFERDLEVVQNGLYDTTSGNYIIINKDGDIEEMVPGWGRRRHEGLVLMVKKGVSNPPHANLSNNNAYAMLLGFWGAD